MSAAIAVACAGDSTGPNGGGLDEGNYTLQTIRGKPTPVRIASDTSYTLVVSAGTIAVHGDGTYSTATTLQETVLNHLSTYYDSTRGNWAHGSAGTFVFTDFYDQSTASATSVNGTLTLIQGTGPDTMTIVYKKN